jgi:hypothetical protein
MSLDSVKGRDTFCTALYKTRNEIFAATQNSDGNTAAEVAANGTYTSGLLMQELATVAHLPILRWATLESARTYFALSASLKASPPLQNPAETLDAVLQKVVDEGLDPFLMLHGYARTRCNFSMFIYGAPDLDAPPDAETAATFAPVDAEAIAIAKKVLPPAPPQGVWPRASAYCTPADQAPSTKPGAETCATSPAD